ncbi:unnamed protein product [Microthlaspi erraticum]|uniref:CCHC-type domain-containing protein n=1 Tax=Microthlaspi erraticum TaxID=1685480 RepID=A0A6D2KGG3_9BRAS|nr:unnamed protein product [Microthlaspi erraticum]
MQNRWFSNGRASARNLPPLAAGEDRPHPPLLPPDPPDPSTPLSFSHFPPLSSPVARTNRSPLPTAPASEPVEGSSIKPQPPTTDVAMAQTNPTVPVQTRSKPEKTGSGTTVHSKSTIPFNGVKKIVTLNKRVPEKLPASDDVEMPQTSNLEQLITSDTAPKTLSNNENLTKLTLKKPFLFQANKASSKALPNTTKPPSIPTNKTTQPTKPPPPQTGAKPEASTPNLAEKLRHFADKSLKRLAPISFSDKGTPRVLIPDAVFQEGAELHKDFIVCYFNGRAPPYSQIQSVLNHMWGKGKKLEIHNNPLTRSMIVRIPSEYLRSKILEKGAWYVGDSMFHTAKWTAGHTEASSASVTIQLWAHLTGVPLDLRHQKGLSLIAGLIEEPKETDDFTKNLVSLTLAHVKVEVNMTKELPDVVEFERESGEVVEVQVEYPWLPPKCSHCHELGHIAKNCLLLPPPSKAVPPSPSKGQESKLQSSKKPKTKPENLPETASQTSTKPDLVLTPKIPNPSNPPENPSAPTTNIPPSTPLPLQSLPQAIPPSSALNLKPPVPLLPSKSLPVILVLPASITPSGEFYPHSPPAPEEKSSLKRSRSHPTLNSYLPLGSSSLNPFKATLAVPVFVPLKNSFASLSTKVNLFHGSSNPEEPSPPS